MPVFGKLRPLLVSAALRYERLFSIGEIRGEIILQWMFGASLLGFFITFYNWIQVSSITIEDGLNGQAVCWPYFQNCDVLFFFHDMSVDYSRSVFFMALYGVILAIVWAMFRRKWILAHLLLAVLFVWTALVVFALAYSITAPYYYYHLFLTAILLFLPHKEFFLKLVFVLLYFLSATVKFDSTWILGSYFTALKTGLPLFPDSLTPIFTNIVIFSQVVGGWFLLSRHVLVQRVATAFFVFFHLYSGIFVYYFYPTMAIVPLLVLFGPLYCHTAIPFTKRAATGWIFIVTLCVFQLLGFITPGDRRLTLEGNRFGMFMFEANHQCGITADVYRDAPPEAARMAPPCATFYCQVEKRRRTESGLTVDRERFESTSSLYRCDPYEWWTRYRRQCEQDPSIRRVALTLDHSINGGPFYRIVDSPDICGESYMLFRRNEWIRLPPEAPVVGSPVENVYHRF